MNRKVKLLLTALLGFSAACSSVKNAPVKGSDDKVTRADSLAGKDTLRKRIIVMYGVRPERTQPFRDANKQPVDGLDPVSERPVDSLDVTLKKLPVTPEKKSDK